MQKKFTEPKLQIIKYLYKAWREKSKVRDHRRPPTLIGLVHGKPGYMASSWACRHLKALVDAGIADNVFGSYGLTPQGVVTILRNEQVCKYLGVKKRRKP